jgi:UDP-sulfoquinovose synthase
VLARSAAAPVATAVPAGRCVLPSMMAAAAPAETMHATGGDSKPKKIFVLGGDGFCGWPTAVHLSDKGHDVVIIDNLSRRKIDVELGCDSLTPITSPEVRVATWTELSGKKLRYEYMDIATEYDRFTQMIKDEKPDTMVHFAEQVCFAWAGCRGWQGSGR